MIIVHYWKDRAIIENHDLLLQELSGNGISDKKENQHTLRQD